VFLTTRQVAELLNVSDDTVHRMRRAGLPAYKPAGHWRYARADVDAFLAARGVRTPTQEAEAAARPRRLAKAAAELKRMGVR
jgi:excisionase family DNA binding protein